MVANKPLSINDPRFDKVKKNTIPAFKMNGRIRFCSWQNSPRHQMPFAIIGIESFKGKTQSEIAILLNKIIASDNMKKKELILAKMKVGKKKPQPKPEIVIDNSPKTLRWEEVEDWDKPSRALEEYNRSELLELLTGEE